MNGALLEREGLTPGDKKGGIIMAVNLKKGQKVDLTKGNPGLSKIMVGLGWDVNRYDGGHDLD